MLSSKAPLGGFGGETCRGHGARAMEQNHKSFNHKEHKGYTKEHKGPCDEAIP